MPPFKALLISNKHNSTRKYVVTRTPSTANIIWGSAVPSPSVATTDHHHPRERNSSPIDDNLLASQLSHEKAIAAEVLQRFFSPAQGFKVYHDGPVLDPLTLRNGAPLPPLHTFLYRIERARVLPKPASAKPCVHTLFFYAHAQVSDQAPILEYLEAMLRALDGTRALCREGYANVIVLLGTEIAFFEAWGGEEKEAHGLVPGSRKGVGQFGMDGMAV